MTRLERAGIEQAAGLPLEITYLCQMPFDLISGPRARIDALTWQLRQIVRQNDVARRLMTMPGFVPVTAVTIAELAAPPEMFSKGNASHR